MNKNLLRYLILIFVFTISALGYAQDRVGSEQKIKLTTEHKISDDEVVNYRGEEVYLDDDDELVQELQGNAIEYGLSVREFKSILVYTSSSEYDTYNTYLWGQPDQTQISDFYKLFLQDVNDAFKKLPSCNGKTLYRGTTIFAETVEEFNKKFKKGNILTFNGFTSTSNDKDVAEDFSDGLVYTIKCKTKAHDVHKLSVYGDDESEYLYPAYSQFKVISKKIIDKEDDEVYEARVTLEEI